MSAVLGCVVVYIMFAGFVEQSAAWIGYKPLRAAETGALAYAVIVTATVALAFGVALAPAALALAGGGAVAVVVGETALALCAGRYVMELLRCFLDEIGANGEFLQKIFSVFQSNTVAYVIFGVILIEVLSFIPYLGWVIKLAVVPAAALGAAAVAALNVFVYKRFCRVPPDPEPPVWDRERQRGIILAKGADRR